MATHRVGLAAGAISMSSRTADKLISQGSGDAALLFLYLLRTGGLYDPAQAAKALGWEASRVTDAFALLENLSLAEGPEAEAAPPSPDPAQAPGYTTADLTGELETPGSPFPGLLRAVEAKLGRRLSPNGVKILLELYDYLGLPPEVILLLVSHMVAEEERKHGPGRRPTMSQIKTVGYRWHQKGVDSAEAVTAYLKKLDYYRTREGEVLALVGIRGRQAVAAERKYIHAWLDWGFPADVISMAYEKTVLNTGSMNWNYCHSILKSWHQKGFRTLEEVAAGEARPSRPSGGGRAAQPPARREADQRTREEVQWMQDFLARHRDES